MGYMYSIVPECRVSGKPRFLSVCVDRLVDNFLMWRLLIVFAFCTTILILEYSLFECSGKFELLFVWLIPFGR